jgi:hypothetical protein
MADLSSFTHKFRACGDSQQNGHKVVKRNRQPVSCQSCRTRKLKCDRKCPCETCIKRGDADACSFGSARSTTGSKNGLSQNAKAHDRIRHLEDLVMQMMEQTPPRSDGNSASMSSNGPPSISPYPSPLDPVLTARTDGHMQVQGNESRYTGSTHWTTILDSIQELKNVIATEDSDQPTEASDPDTLFGASRPPSLAKVLQTLPPKVEVDRLLSIYFNAKYAIIPILHVYQFQRQYEAFWINPLETPPLWIAILFSIMGIAEVLRGTKLSKPKTPIDPLLTPKEPYVTSAAQCLILGGFTRPRRFVIESLLLFSQLTYAASPDPSREVGLIFAIIVRLAFRMGESLLSLDMGRETADTYLRLSPRPVTSPKHQSV